MAKEVLPYGDSQLGKKQQVRKMFDNISGNYDRLNRIMTLGADQRWRSRLVRKVKEHGAEAVLDIATGTGDLALALAETGASRVVGLDLAPAMLEIGRQKVEQAGLRDRVEMVVGDSEALDFADASFDAVTVAFGVRNFEDLEQGLSEIYRVLKPGGILAVLETSVPEKQPFKWGYRLHCRYVLPLMGKLLSGNAAAYRYLSDSAAVFPYGDAFDNILGKIGFIGMNHAPQTFGVATIYTASK